MKEEKNDVLGKIEVKKVPANEAKRGDEGKELKDTLEKKKQKIFLSKKTITMLGIILIICAGIIITVFSGVEEENYPGVYNNYIFEKTGDGVWQTTIKTVTGDRRMEFYNHPIDVENYVWKQEINAYLGAVQRAGGKVNIAISPSLLNESFDNPAVAAIEIKRVTELVFNLETKSAFTTLEGIKNPGDNLTIMNCEDANATNFVIEIDSSEYSKVESEEFCAKLSANSSKELIKLADLFGYKTIGIID